LKGDFVFPDDINGSVDHNGHSTTDETEEKPMKKLIDATVKPVLILGGLGTSAAFLYAFRPYFALESIAKLDASRDHIIFVQHWGFMVGLMGAFMVAAAFIESWRTPVILYVLLAKVYMVYLVAANASLPCSQGFHLLAWLDAFLTVWSILYFIALKKR
jgi:hypothetical protein